MNCFIDIEKVLKSMSMVVLETYSREFPHGCVVGKKERKGTAANCPFLELKREAGNLL